MKRVGGLLKAAWITDLEGSSHLLQSDVNALCHLEVTSELRTNLVPHEHGRREMGSESVAPGGVCVRGNIGGHGDTRCQVFQAFKKPHRASLLVVLPSQLYSV